jgi:hypothetical protein
VSVSGPSCPDHLFSEELRDVEINTQIHKVLAHGADLIPRASPASLREGVDNTRVSPYGSIFGCLCNFILSPRSCSCTGCWVRSQRATRDHLARGRGEVSGELCLQQEVAGAETKKAGLECCLDGDEGVGGGEDTPL